MSSFGSPHEKHEHSFKNVLSYMYEYDDFMDSVGRVIDLGCDVEATDMLWWANATTRDETQTPLGIKCVGVNTFEKLNVKHSSISYQNHDIESLNRVKRTFDIVWCYDQLQYLLNPYQALSNWWHIAEKDAMLVIAVPQTVNTEYHIQEYNLSLGHKYHYTMPQLIYMLAVSGWDCRSGFFKKTPGDPWLYAIVYKSDVEPMDPKETNIYKLVEQTELLPQCAVDGIHRYGKLRQRDLILPWLDKNITIMENH
jgi:2-polyprenyl-3-methyl-5-hydroxy-6-metoxy-1,4-benzoquinol methylase